LYSELNELLLATNNGSLHYIVLKSYNLFVFASEEYMLKKALKKIKIKEELAITKLEAQTACFINLKELKPQIFSLKKESSVTVYPELSKENKQILDISKINKVNLAGAHTSNSDIRLSKLLQNNSKKIQGLRRCTKCLLPETFPNIRFDSKGECNYCKNNKPIKYKGEKALAEFAKKYKKRDGKPEVIVPLSGGRDSCFALHYIKKELNLTPIAYTYDWGMVTDLARRNISRMTGELGVEHILISADIRKKRKFIQKNVNAWLKRPILGTVPLFMAGDKQFFYYANKLKKELNTDFTVFGMNPLEQTDFKVAFTGIREKKKQNRHYRLSEIDKLKIAGYYSKEFLLNPSYINSSLIDTGFAFLSYYFIKHNYQIFFEYFEWNENIIENTIINNYNWETAEDTRTTWRIGDGTASFYNYIYYNIAGFSENDTFRSNQIRQGLISREEALKKVEEENNPRFESIKWYCDTIGIDFEKTIKKINSIPKLYNV